MAEPVKLKTERVDLICTYCVDEGRGERVATRITPRGTPLCDVCAEDWVRTHAGEHLQVIREPEVSEDLAAIRAPTIGGGVLITEDVVRGGDCLEEGAAARVAGGHGECREWVSGYHAGPMNPAGVRTLYCIGGPCTGLVVSGEEWEAIQAEIYLVEHGQQDRRRVPIWHGSGAGDWEVYVRECHGAQLLCAECKGRR